LNLKYLQCMTYHYPFILKVTPTRIQMKTKTNLHSCLVPDFLILASSVMCKAFTTSSTQYIAAPPTSPDTF
jgi:hypothetical protein